MTSPARAFSATSAIRPFLLVRSGPEIFAIDAYCSHYHGPLVDGLVVGDRIRCPWHHACFDLRTGEATRAPALTALAVWQVEHDGDRIFVRQKHSQPKSRGKGPVEMPDRIVIVGDGAAGFAAAEMLRRQEFRGSIVMLSRETAPPVDRPNLSKDYLAGRAPEDWLPLRPESFYAEAGIDMRLKTKVGSIDAKARNVVIAGGRNIPYDRLLLATGAEPVRLPIPGADQSHVHTLRSLADCRSIINSVKAARRAIVNKPSRSRPTSVMGSRYPCPAMLIDPKPRSSLQAQAASAPFTSGCYVRSPAMALSLIWSSAQTSAH